MDSFNFDLQSYPMLPRYALEYTIFTKLCILALNVLKYVNFDIVKNLLCLVVFCFIYILPAFLILNLKRFAANRNLLSPVAILAFQPTQG